jgi:hypothetical protein
MNTRIFSALAALAVSGAMAGSAFAGDTTGDRDPTRDARAALAAAAAPSSSYGVSNYGANAAPAASAPAVTTDRTNDVHVGTDDAVRVGTMRDGWWKDH